MIRATTSAVVAVLFFATTCEGRRVHLETPAKPLAPAESAEVRPKPAATFAEESEDFAPEHSSQAVSAKLTHNGPPQIAADPAATAPEAAGQPTPSTGGHSEGKSPGLSALAHLGRMASQLKEAMASKLPSSQAAGDRPITFQELLTESRKNPLSPKVLPILISGVFAAVLILCICCPCCRKQARSSSHFRDGGRRSNRSAQRPGADGTAVSSDGSGQDAEDVGRGVMERTAEFGSQGTEERRKANAEVVLGLSSSLGSKMGSKKSLGSSSSLGSSGSIGSKKSEEKADVEAALLKEIQDLAAQTARTVQKYPKSGRSFFSKTRHVATLPAPERTGASASKAAEPRRLIQRWRNGTFGWWESEEAFLQGLEPKGSMDFKAIVKVQTYKDDKSGRGVLVKYNSPTEKNEMEPAEMILMFAAKSDADEWGYALWSFLAKLRTRPSPPTSALAEKGSRGQTRTTGQVHGDRM